MAYLHSALTAHDLASHERKSETKRGFFSHLMQAIAVSRMKQADREIAAYFARSGGKFTDESEREIERRLTAGSRI
jgi:hypothetical protein